ncbi:hypothetical protein JCM8208_000911 [Rhodotorula glutinis]
MGFKVVEDRPTPPEVYNWRIYTTGVVIAFGAGLFGYTASFIGTAIKTPSFQADFGLTSDSADNADIISCFQAAAIGGSIGGYACMENFGRKKTLMGTSLLFCVGAILQVVATGQLGLIYAGRVVVGLAVGFVTTICPVYLAELSPPAIRGRLVGFYEISYQLMAVVAFWLIFGEKQHMDMTQSITWRIPFAIQLIPGGLLFAGTFFLKESPRYLLKRHRLEEATKNLCWLRMLPASHPYIEEELSATVVQINREKAVSDKFTGNAVSRYFRGIWNEVSTPGIRNRFVIGAFIMMWQNMSGINALNYYSPTLFAAVGVEDTSLYTGIYGVLKAAASLFFFIFLVDTWGRRSPLMFGAVASGLCQLYVAIYLQVAQPESQATLSASSHMGGQAGIAFLFLFAIFYCMGWNGLAWVICAEMYPAQIRGFAAMWTSIWQWACQFVVARETPSMLHSKMGTSGTFFLFFACNMLSAVFTYFFIPETKGRTLEEMDVVFGVVRPGDSGPKPQGEHDYVEDRLAVKAGTQKPADEIA